VQLNLNGNPVLNKILFEVVDDAAPMSDSHVDDTQADNSHFMNGMLI